MALQAEGFKVFVYSRSRKPNEKAALAESIGAEYLSSEEVSPQELREHVGGRIDVVYEAAGVARVAFDVLEVLGSNGVFVLTSVAGPEPPRTVDTAALVRRMVLENQVIVGTVNAGPADYASAIDHLGAFRERWGDAVSSLITGRHPMESYEELLRGRSAGIKNVISVAG
jgi:glucose 1-dehydrogenase